MILNPEIEKVIKLHALENKSEECCGVITENECIRCDNEAEYRFNHFLISEEQLSEITQDKIIGFYHSHSLGLSKELSIVDMAVSEKLGIYLIMYHIESDSFIEYAPKDKFFNYVGRPFVSGLFDCGVLVKDYYKYELNINFQDFDFPGRNSKDLITYIKNNNLDYSNLLENFIISQGGFKVKEPKKHDVLLIQLTYPDFPLHLAVYLGDDKILHHIGHQNSRIEYYNTYYRKMTKGIFRHAFNA